MALVTLPGCNAIFGLDAPSNDVAMGDAPPPDSELGPDASVDAAAALCEGMGGEPDEDADGLPDSCDLCPMLAASPTTGAGTQADADSDGVGDACDPLPMKAGDQMAFIGFAGAPSDAAWTINGFDVGAGEATYPATVGPAGLSSITLPLPSTLKGVQVVARFVPGPTPLGFGYNGRFGVRSGDATTSLSCVMNASTPTRLTIEGPTTMEAMPSPGLAPLTLRVRAGFNQVATCRAVLGSVAYSTPEIAADPLGFSAGVFAEGTTGPLAVHAVFVVWREN